MININKSVKKILTFIPILLLLSVSVTGAVTPENTTFKPNMLDEEEWYTLFAPQYSKMTYLINCYKEVVHIWRSNYIPGHSAYLLENGNLLRTAELLNPVFLSGGLGGGVQEIDWNDTLVWEFTYSNDTHALHHDIQHLPNGNILMIAWEVKNYTEAVAAGRNPNLISPLFGLWPDHIIEVQPSGSTSGLIVWEWHAWDHLIQDYDPSKANYGVVGDHPELIDINYAPATGIGSDWLHTNSIDYNEEFDQIILSIHNFNEIWVIDHSTTKEEAAGHTGGRSGKGGDLLYRWGNPRTYRRGTTEDQKLFGQHDARWIDPGCPGEGNILIFNNGYGRPGEKYSSIDEIVPPIDSDGYYYSGTDEAYGPEEQTWIYTAKNPTDFYAYMISGAQRLTNGNTMICDGKKGILFEVTPEKDTVWEYLNPYPTPLLNSVFKIESYPSYYSGLAKVREQPRNPEKPSGPTNGAMGVQYNFTTRTTDPQEGDVYYLFDWGDNTNSGWIGPYRSGEMVNASHSWNRRGSFSIKVKAMDMYGHHSGWSDPLPVVMPCSYSRIIQPFLQRLFERFPSALPFLRHLLGH
jgi:hypothetical protein